MRRILLLEFLSVLFIIMGFTLQTAFANPNIQGTVGNDVRYQRGYIRSNGTFVKGHYKKRSDNTNLNNFGTIGNVNPYTNQRGSVACDYSNEAYNYGRGKTIFRGSRGGQYYINSKGNKTYVPKR